MILKSFQGDDDGDGIPDHLDNDDDGDGIPDDDEGTKFLAGLFFFTDATVSTTQLFTKP